jgi:hypothetical protein
MMLFSRPPHVLRACLPTRVSFTIPRLARGHLVGYVGAILLITSIVCCCLSCRGPGTGKSYNARLPGALLLTVVVLIPQCPPSTDPVPYCAEEWTPQQAGLPEWNADEEAVLKMKQALFLFNEDKPSYARYFRFYCPAQYL